MKTIMKLSAATIGILLFTMVLNSRVSAQTVQQDKPESKPIPAEVQKITDRCCSPCHAEPGNGMALSRVNFSKWTDYSPTKQAMKAKAICGDASEGKMPPKKYQKNHPENVPTADEIKIICDWVTTYQEAVK